MKVRLIKDYQFAIVGDVIDYNPQLAQILIDRKFAEPLGQPITITTSSAESTTVMWQKNKGADLKNKGLIWQQTGG